MAAPTYPGWEGEQRQCRRAFTVLPALRQNQQTYAVILTTNSHVSEEQPARDQGLLGGAWGLAHDVQIRGVEAQGGGGQTVSHQVDPQQLDGDQGLGQTQGSSQEDTGRDEKQRELSQEVRVR